MGFTKEQRVVLEEVARTEGIGAAIDKAQQIMGDNLAEAILHLGSQGGTRPSGPVQLQTFPWVRADEKIDDFASTSAEHHDRQAATTLEHYRAQHDPTCALALQPHVQEFLWTHSESAVNCTCGLHEAILDERRSRAARVSLGRMVLHDLREAARLSIGGSEPLGSR